MISYRFCFYSFMLINIKIMLIPMSSFYVCLWEIVVCLWSDNMSLSISLSLSQMKSICLSLQDSNLLVQRNVLEILLFFFPFCTCLVCVF